jgi:hypothetical protein
MTTAPRTTSVTYHSDHETTTKPLEADEVRFEAGGAGWMGTFATVVRRALTDILEGGEPVRAMLVAWDATAASDGRYVTVYGDIASYADNVITFADGYTVDDDVLLSVTV